MYRLEPIPHIGQCTRHDGGERIGEITLFNFQVYGRFGLASPLFRSYKLHVDISSASTFASLTDVPVRRPGTQHSQADINTNTKKRQVPKRNHVRGESSRVYVEYVPASLAKTVPRLASQIQTISLRRISARFLLAMTGGVTCTRVTVMLSEISRC